MSTRGLRYVVIEEIFSGIAELSLSNWPALDAQGRLRFTGEDFHVEADAELLRLFLRRERMPRKAVAREIRTGDTFGVAVRPRSLTAFLSEPVFSPTTSPSERRRLLDPKTWDWLDPPVYDITAEAREAAKLAYYAALTGPLPRGEK